MGLLREENQRLNKLAQTDWLTGLYNRMAVEQMAVILKQYADKHGYSLPVKLEAENFADSSQISSASARSAVLALQQAGIMGSRDGSNFAPKDNVSRAEAAVILRKFLGAVISNDKIQDERL